MTLATPTLGSPNKISAMPIQFNATPIRDLVTTRVLTGSLTLTLDANSPMPSILMLSNTNSSTLTVNLTNSSGQSLLRNELILTKNSSTNVPVYNVSTNVMNPGSTASLTIGASSTRLVFITIYSE